MSFVLLILFLAIVLVRDNADPISVFDLLYAGFLATLPVTVLGQFIFNKDGIFFDAILARPINISDYVRAKLGFLVLYTLMNYLVILPLFIFISPLFVFLIVASMLYSLGISIGLITYWSSFDTDKIDYQQGAFFNPEGVSFWKQVVTLPPFVLLILFPALRSFGIALMFLSGIAGLLLYPKWIELISNNLMKRRYIMLEGFRD